MKKSSYIIILLCVLSSHQINAQHWIDTTIYNAQVKLVDEFINRFNGDELRTDIDTLSNKDTLNILLLFDLAKFTSDTCLVYQEALSFVDTILSTQTKINYADSMWCAEAECKAVLAGKQYPLTFLLSIEPKGKDMYKWVISDVQSPLFNSEDLTPIKGFYLMPDSHEMEFMGLQRNISEAPQYITSLMPNSFALTPLQVFASLVYAKQLKIKPIEQIKFHFYQVPGWKFTIRYFSRENKNSGWLIDSLQRMTDEEKQLFLNKLH